MSWSKTIYDILRLVILNFLHRVDQNQITYIYVEYKKIIVKAFYSEFYISSGDNYFVTLFVKNKT